MTTTLFTVAGLEVTLAAMLVSIAVGQWLFFASSSALGRGKSKEQVAGRDRRVLVSSGVFIALWLVAFDGRTLIGWTATSASRAATVTASPSRGSCSLITTGMTEAEVERLLGKADDVRANEEIRGPGAKIWIYRGSRCALHFFDDKVEFIE